MLAGFWANVEVKHPISSDTGAKRLMKSAPCVDDRSPRRYAMENLLTNERPFELRFQFSNGILL